MWLRWRRRTWRLRCSKRFLRKEEGKVNGSTPNYTKVFPAVGFLAEVLQHLPDSRCRLILTYGLYSSRARGTPCPAGRRRQLFRRNGESLRLRAGRVVPSTPPGSPRSRGVQARPSETTLRPCRTPEEAPPQLSVSAKHSRAAFHGTPWSWARLVKKVYDADLQGGSRRQPVRAR